MPTGAAIESLPCVKDLQSADVPKKPGLGIGMEYFVSKPRNAQHKSGCLSSVTLAVPSIPLPSFYPDSQIPIGWWSHLLPAF